MSPFVLAVFLALQNSPSGPPDEIKDALARAESLYFEAKFNDSIQLLTRINDVLKTQPDRMPERINVKLQLALASVGLNNPTAAKSSFSELFAMNLDFNLDAQQYPPKVITLANEAKAEQLKLRCQTAAGDARKSLAAGDSAALLTLWQAMKAKCTELAAIEPEAADLVYKKGLTDYKQGDLLNAVQNFRAALKLTPNHELAAQYLELAENKLQVAQDRVLLDWQKNFETRQFKQAAVIYRQIASFGNSAAKPLDQMTAEYRQALVPLVEDVNRACASKDEPMMNEVRSRISEMLPEPSFGEDIRAKIVPCVVEAPAPTKIAAVEPTVAPPVIEKAHEEVVKAAPRNGCVQVQGALVLPRLKSRVEPEIPPAVRTFYQNSQVTVNIKARIDERGNVSVGEATGLNVVLNNSVRTAVEKWKFTPMVDQDGPRCVDTEFPIVFGK